MTHDPVPPPREHGEGQSARIAWGSILLAAGLLWLLSVAGVDVPWGVVLPGALVLVGLTLLVLSTRGRGHSGLVALGVVLTVLSALQASVETVVGFDVRNLSAGQQSVRPSALEDLRPSYELAAGSLTVDLRELDLPSGETRLEVGVAAGEVEVILPEGVTLDVDANLVIGELDVLGRERSGFGVEIDDRFAGDDPETVLVLVADVAVGRLEVRR